MKKALSIILVLALACSLFGGAALAASSDYVLTGGSVTVDGTTDKTVDVVFTSVPGGMFKSFEADWSLKEKESSSYLTLSALTSEKEADAMENDPATGRVIFFNSNFTNDSYNLNVAANGAIWTATYTVDKNTPAGEYTVSLDVQGLSDGNGDEITDAEKLWTATITVTNPAEGYTVTVAADKTTAAVNDTVKITLDVTNSDKTTFNAFQGKLTYNSSVFTYNASGSTLGGFNVSDSTGELTIMRHGSNVTIPGSGAELILAFTAKANGTGTFTLAAGVSEADQADGNILEATVSGEPSVTVSQTYTVTYDGDGATGTAPTQDPVTAGTKITLPAATAFTKEGYTFAGWKCSVDGVTYDAGASYTMTAVATTFTAQWTAIPTYAVTFDISGATGTAPTMAAQAEGKTFTLPDDTGLTREGYNFAGWKCSVDGVTYNSGASYTMTAIATTFTAQWTEKAATATASIVDGYLDGYTLIKVTTENTTKAPTYDGNSMYKLSGDAYDADAYYYVVPGDVTAETAQGKLGWSDTAATTLTKNGDANQTGLIDINDAQFIYNLYNGVTVTYYMSVEQLLASDVNGDGKVGTDDCAAAIDKIQ